MKTNIISSQKISIYSLFGFLILFFTSCSSYQNSSAYDSDGVYGNSQTIATTQQANGYQTYFNSLQELSLIHI